MFSSADLASFSVSVGSVSVGSGYWLSFCFVSDSVVSFFTGSAFSATDSASTLAGSLASSVCSVSSLAVSVFSAVVSSFYVLEIFFDFF